MIKIPQFKNLLWGWLVAVVFIFSAQTHADDINIVIENLSMDDRLGDIGLVLEKANAYAHSTDNKLRHKSTQKGDRTTFSGKWRAPALPDHLAGKYVYSLALLSDDGCDVTVNQQNALEMLEDPIALPDTGRSLQILNVRIEADTEVDISLAYSNVKYTPREGTPDIDGCTLFVYLKASRDVKLESVGFSGGHELCSDVTLAAYTAPQWKDLDGNGVPDLASNGDRNDSIAYTKNTRPSLEATFKVGTLQPDSVFEVKAFASNAHLVLPIQLKVENGSAKLPITAMLTPDWNEVTKVEETKPAKWLDSIKIYRKSADSALRVYWSYQIDGGGWTRFATSMHQVYLTAATPTVANNQESLFYYACNKSDGASGVDGKAVANQIYTDFKTLEMQRVDRFSGIPTGDFLKFWRGADYKSVLEHGSGVCGAWADFFNDTLKVHGYTATTVGITAKNILFSDGKPRNGPSWIPKGNPQILIGNAPRSGQGHSSEAPAAWPSHAISFAFNEYYDPSYGIGPASSKASYEDLAIDWYGYLAQVGPKIVPTFEPRIIGTAEKLDYK